MVLLREVCLSLDGQGNGQGNAGLIMLLVKWEDILYVLPEPKKVSASRTFIV